MAKAPSREKILGAELQPVEDEQEKSKYLQKACEDLIENLKGQQNLTKWKERNIRAQIKSLRWIVRHCQTLRSAQKGL